MALQNSIGGGGPTTNVLSVAGLNLTSNVNGVASSVALTSVVTPSAVCSAVNATAAGVQAAGDKMLAVDTLGNCKLITVPSGSGPTTNTLVLAAGNLTSTVNGVAASVPIGSIVSPANICSAIGATAAGVQAAGDTMLAVDILGNCKLITVPSGSGPTTNSLTVAGGNLISTVNGVITSVSLGTIVTAATVCTAMNTVAAGVQAAGDQFVAIDTLGNCKLIAVPSGSGATTNTLTSAANVMTSTVNGVIATANIVNTNVLSIAAGSLNSSVNGVGSSISLTSIVSPSSICTALIGIGTGTYNTGDTVLATDGSVCKRVTVAPISAGNTTIVGTGTVVPGTTNGVVEVTATGTVTLNTPLAGQRTDFWIVNITPTNTVTVVPALGTIGGAASVVMTGANAFTSTQGTAIHVYWDGAKWVLI